MKRVIGTAILVSLLATALFASSAMARRRYHPYAQLDPTTETLINMVASWAIAYSQCKGKDAPPDKCAESERLSTSLKDLGWCYGETDQVSAGFRWHHC